MDCILSLTIGLSIHKSLKGHGLSVSNKSVDCLENLLHKRYTSSILIKRKV